MSKDFCINNDNSGDKFNCKIFHGNMECPNDCPRHELKSPIRNYDDLLKAGTTAQLEKLQQNEHKRCFEDIDLIYAFNRLCEELNELTLEMFDFSFKFFPVHGDDMLKYEYFNKVRNEAADIANFAHMIIYKCDQELKRS